MARIRNKDVFDFLIIYYAGYTDASEMQASFETEKYQCTLIEGLDYDQTDVWRLQAMAWRHAVDKCYKNDNLIAEIKLLGVDHGTINI